MNTMNKKDYLIAVLEKLETEWLPAWWLKIIAQEWKLSNEMIDIFVEVIQMSLKDADNKQLQEKLQQSTDILQQIKNLEQESKQHDQEDLEALDTLLETL